MSRPIQHRHHGRPLLLAAVATGLLSLGAPSLAKTGFGAGWIDYDNDGRLDLFIANGAVTLREEQRGQAVPYKEKKLLIHNDGQKFTDVTDRAGRVFHVLEVSRRAAFGDLDNDGRVDIVITNNNGPARVLLNQSTNPRSLQVRLEGTGKMSRDGLGARVTVRREGFPDLVRRVHTDSSYCSASDPRVHFGLGDKGVIKAIEVAWPDGSLETWYYPKPGAFLTLRHGTGHSP